MSMYELFRNHYSESEWTVLGSPKCGKQTASPPTAVERNGDTLKVSTTFTLRLKSQDWSLVMALHDFISHSAF